MYFKLFFNLLDCDFSIVLSSIHIVVFQIISFDKMDGSDDSDCEESGVRYLASLMSETCTELSRVVRDYREETTEEGVRVKIFERGLKRCKKKWIEVKT